MSSHEEEAFDPARIAAQASTIGQRDVAVSGVGPLVARPGKGNGGWTGDSPPSHSKTKGKRVPAAVPHTARGLSAELHRNLESRQKKDEVLDIDELVIEDLGFDSDTDPKPFRGIFGPILTSGAKLFPGVVNTSTPKLKKNSFVVNSGREEPTANTRLRCSTRQVASIQGHPWRLYFQVRGGGARKQASYWTEVRVLRDDGRLFEDRYDARSTSYREPLEDAMFSWQRNPNAALDDPSMNAVQAGVLEQYAVLEIVLSEVRDYLPSRKKRPPITGEGGVGGTNQVSPAEPSENYVRSFKTSPPEAAAPGVAPVYLDAEGNEIQAERDGQATDAADTRASVPDPDSLLGATTRVVTDTAQILPRQRSSRFLLLCSGQLIRKRARIMDNSCRTAEDTSASASAALADFKRLFTQELDLNGSGVLSKGELRLLLYDLRLDDEEFARVFDKIDVRRDNCVTLDELLFRVGGEYLRAVQRPLPGGEVVGASAQQDTGNTGEEEGEGGATTNAIPDAVGIYKYRANLGRHIVEQWALQLLDRCPDQVAVAVPSAAQKQHQFDDSERCLEFGVVISYLLTLFFIVLIFIDGSWGWIFLVVIAGMFYWGLADQFRFQEALGSDPLVGLQAVVERIEKCHQANPLYKWQIQCYHTVTTGSGKNKRTRRVNTHSAQRGGKLLGPDVSEKFAPEMHAEFPLTRMKTDLRLDLGKTSYVQDFDAWVKDNWKDAQADFSRNESLGDIQRDFIAEWV
ncbi:unnamed protein product, partial [Amoebophrya sp. A25]|eukprot:GSA25T00013274001.1